MEPRNQGLLEKEPLQEVDEEMVSEVDLNNTITEEEKEEMHNELTKLEEEIATLRQVLSSKEKRHSELKQRLGITPLSELRHNLSRGWNDMQTSTAYKKTSETLSTAGQKTTAAFSNLGSAISRKFGDMSRRSVGPAVEAVLRRFSLQQLRPVLRTSPLTTYQKTVSARVNDPCLLQA
uniref:Tpd52 like 1 n=1 Tax=Astyanax mexicanus TaxID=7994 RepID=A0A8B9RGW5_ASTMX